MRPLLLTRYVHDEILEMLKRQWMVRTRLLQRIKDQVQELHHYEDYACARWLILGILTPRKLFVRLLKMISPNWIFSSRISLAMLLKRTQVSVIQRELPQ